MGVITNPSLTGIRTAASSEAAYDFGTNIPAATVRDGICKAQVRTGAGVLSLDGDSISGGSYSAGFDGGRLITVYSTGDLRSLTFTITGTDKDGTAQTEDITGPNNTTATGTKFFQTVTAVASSGTIGTNVEIGYSSSLVVLDIVKRANHFKLDPTNGETVYLAIYGASGSGWGDRCSLSLDYPATGTFTWADGTIPSDVRIYFAGGTEVTPTAGGLDWFEFISDGATTGGDAIWYCSKSVQDIKA